MSKKTVIYIRVSTSKQANHGYGMDAQLERCMAYCTMRNIPQENIVVLQDGGYSGSSLQRPNFQKMMEGIRNGLYETIIIFKLDRISRSIGDFAKLLKFISDNGVQLVSVNEGLDLTNITGQLIAQILIIFAEFELRQMSIRTSEALRNKALNGYYPHGGKPPLGYKRTALQKGMTKQERLKRGLEIDEEGLKMYQYIIDKFLETHSIKATHNLYMVKYGTRHFLNEESIHDILRNKTYLGYITFPSTGETIKLSHPPLITDEKFAQIQKILDRRVHVSTFSYLFKDLLICDICHSHLKCAAGTSRTKQRYLYYRCPKCGYYISENKLIDELGTPISKIIQEHGKTYESEQIPLNQQLAYLVELKEKYEAQFATDKLTFEELQKANANIERERKKLHKKINASKQLKRKDIRKTKDHAYLNAILLSKIDHIIVSKKQHDNHVVKIQYLK